MNVLAIFSHPDDEVLGCGATLSTLAASGHEVHACILATGSTSRSGIAASEAEEEIGQLQMAAYQAIQCLGGKSVIFGGFPDNRMDSVPLLDVVHFIEKVAGELVPDVVFTQHCGDLNIDHRVTHEAVLTAFRPLPGLKPTTIYSCEVLSSTEWASSSMPGFQPNSFVPVSSDALEAKQQAMACYTGEIRSWPHPRSREGINHQAALRGSQCGYEFAEAFHVLRDFPFSVGA
jgi:LmbE family N-acetylglucosaminyl deacetylase